jgi:hypothetical protein
LGVEEFFLERLQQIVIKLEVSFESPIRHPATSLQYGDGLVEHFFKRHALPSTSASTASVSGGQKVMAISRYIAMA